MPQNPTASANYLEQYVREVLRSHGFDNLSPADQAAFLPQFMAEAERRLGLALTPHLTSPAAAEEFSNLLKKDTSPEEWYRFWTANVPNFSDIVRTTLEAYAKEVFAAFAM